jgi:hypothetical protein
MEETSAEWISVTMFLWALPVPISNKVRRPEDY